MELIRSLYASQYFSTVHFIFVATHVSLAILALVVAPAAMAVVKGGQAHRRWGNVYLWSMLTVNGSALILLTWRFNIFLFGITILTSYSVITGYRSLQRKRPQAGQSMQQSVQPTWFDWGFTMITLTTGIGLIGWGVATLLGWTAAFIPAAEGAFIVMGILPLVFGLAISQSAVVDLRLYRNPSTDRNWWWYYHMERMVGSYIGLFTALMVQQVGPRLPGEWAWIVWIAPTVIGSPLLALWITHYRKKFAGQSKRRTLPQPEPVSS